MLSNVFVFPCVHAFEKEREPRDQLFSENRKCLEPHDACPSRFPIFSCFYFLRSVPQGVTHRGGLNLKVLTITVLLSFLKLPN